MINNANKAAAAPAQTGSDALERELEAADAQAKDVFESGKEDAKKAKIHTCPGPRGNPGIFLDPTPESRKQANWRWLQVRKK